MSSFEKSDNDFNVFSAKLINKKEILSKLLTDVIKANSLGTTLNILKKISKKLIEIIDAAKRNFLLRDFFKRQKKDKGKKIKELENLNK